MSADRKLDTAYSIISERTSWRVSCRNNHPRKLAPESLKLLTLNPFLAKIVAQFEGLAAAQGIQLSYEPPEQTVQIWADPALLRQVIENLLSNACQYTSIGELVRLQLIPHLT